MFAEEKDWINLIKFNFYFLKNNEGKNELAYTHSGSLLELPCDMAGILENHQTKDGIVIPEILQPYTGFKIID